MPNLPLLGGWFRDYSDLNLNAGLGVAGCEFPTLSEPADYMLTLDGVAAGTGECASLGRKTYFVDGNTEKGAYKEQETGPFFQEINQ